MKFMFEEKETVSMRLESVHNMDNMNNHSNICVENFIKSGCQADLKNSLEYYESEILPLVGIIETQLEEEAYKAKTISPVFQSNSEEYSSSAWRSQWESKCKEWLYRDRFNFEVLNFAKKIYFH